MEQFLPATGRILRYWYTAVSCRCRHQLYDYLGVRPVASGAASRAETSRSWTDSEVWSRPEPGHERTVVIREPASGHDVPRLQRRVRMPAVTLSRPAPRRRGAALHSTFKAAGSRLGRARGSAPGIGLI